MSAINLDILAKISGEFHHELKQNWNSLEDYVINGAKWIDDIRLLHNDEKLTNFAKEILLIEMRVYATTSMTAREILESESVLIMKGGGIKGLAYIGALEEINKFYSFNWYAGTSAGAITAILLSAGFTTEELKDILEKKNFGDFKDANFPKALLNLCTYSGMYKANSFVKWISELLATKLHSPIDVKLKDLPFRATVYASRRNSSAIIFDSNIEKSKYTSAAFAARCSMSIPIFFTPQKQEGLNVLDGGIQNNFPVEVLLKSNPYAKFIGLYLGDETFKFKRNNIFLDLYYMWTESNDHETLEKYRQKIVVIDTAPISTVQFSLTSEEKDFLLEAGRLAAIRFLFQKKMIEDINEGYDYDVRKHKLEKTRSKLKIKKRKKFWKKVTIIAVILLGLYSTSLL